MANTYALISNITVGSGGASTIDFTSIPQTFSDLCLRVSIRTSAADVNDGGTLIFNNDSGTNYSRRQLYGDGSAAGSDSGTGLSYIQLPPLNGNGSTANTFSNGEIYIPNYTSTVVAKAPSNDGTQETNDATSYMGIIATIWNPGTQAAINRITISCGSGTFLQYSTAYLYGIKNS
jgi:hypothetical protein